MSDKVTCIDERAIKGAAVACFQPNCRGTMQCLRVGARFVWRCPLCKFNCRTIEGTAEPVEPPKEITVFGGWDGAGD